MKKMYIKVMRNKKERLVCTSDISKMYYFKSRPIPAVPKYSDDLESDKESNETCPSPGVRPMEEI